MTTSSDRPAELIRDTDTGLVLAPAEPDTSAGRSWHVGAGTGIGSLPGTSPDESARMIAGELPELPYLAELPARGVGADAVGRTAGLLVDIFAEVVPSGWRVTRRPGRDTRRANDFMEWDLDAATEHYAGADWVKVQVCGPWTLAAEVELGSGNRALTDTGAVDDIAASLIQGLLDHLDVLRRRLPGTSFVVQVDEPLLPQVIGGTLSTPSGFGTVRSTDAGRVGAVLKRVTDALARRPTIARCDSPSAPLLLLRASGFDAVSVDFSGIGVSAARLVSDRRAAGSRSGPARRRGFGGTAGWGLTGRCAAGRRRCSTCSTRLGSRGKRCRHMLSRHRSAGLADADDEWALTAMKTALRAVAGVRGPARRLVAPWRLPCARGRPRPGLGGRVVPHLPAGRFHGPLQELASR